MQEFLATQPGEKTAVSSDRSLSLFSRDSTPVKKDQSTSNQMAFDSGMPSFENLQAMSMEISEDTFLQQADESIMVDSGVDINLMKDFFVVESQNEAQPQQSSQPPQQENMTAAAKQQAPEKTARRRRKKDSLSLYRSEGVITLPRETIREWLKDVSDIVCQRPLLSKSKRGSKRVRLDPAPNKSPNLQGACAELLELFEQQQATNPGN